jgi:GNAT superfamily N-acetyltransferase
MRGLCFVEVADSQWRKLFDEALDITHYAGSCQRVGRCMRLAIVENRNWVGGIVLGSTFANVLVRDEALGLRKYIENYKERGLTNPWNRNNHSYWKALQRIVNHARTFVFPEFQGRGIGIASHKLLLTEGIKLWEKKYRGKVYALDTLCTESDSKLFSKNGWTFAGQTKGYSSDPKKKFSNRLAKFKIETIGTRHNVGLSGGSTKWMVWVRVLGKRI